ncbi:hypothetical protein [Spirillospora albida]|uniref:hypothetical protein n=1 Tax=Spirillospora albida TaxID=58123 RepID=UPI0004C15866|nr:hypothetical protein [Spirillospora albida]
MPGVIGLAIVMDVIALAFLWGFSAVLRRRRTVPSAGDSGQPAGLALMAVGLTLLSIPLWCLA